jgi:hypothetical protein
VCVQDSGGIFNWNGTQNMGPGSTLNVQGSGFSVASINLESSGLMNVTSGGAVAFNGGSLTVNAGSAFTMQPALNVGGGTGVINIGSSGTGLLNVNAGSQIISARLATKREIAAYQAFMKGEP